MLVKSRLVELEAYDAARKLFESVLSKYAVDDPASGSTILPENIFKMASLTK
jgi:hypothetical protein